MSDLITCKICKKEFKKLTATHLKIHKITYSDYQKKFVESNQGRKCQYINDFHNWKCPNYAMPFTDSCILHLRSSNKDEKSFLKEFEKLKSSQEKSNSNETIYLEGIHFPTEIKFQNQIFEKKVSFSKSEFYDKVSMIGVIFEKGANFKHCKFGKGFNLTIIKFLGFAEFGNCTFRSLATFQNVDFNGATFHKAIFYEKGKFSRCLFKDYVSFRNIKTPEESSLISFYYNDFPIDRKTEFEYNDMSKISFLRSDLRFVKFDNVKWHFPKFPATTRNCLINEFVNYTNGKSWEENWEIVKEQYQTLKMNFEDNRNCAAAGDFHYGEMECQRKSLGWFRFLPTLTTIYWACSGYGERIKRAVFVLGILLIFWILVHMTLGLYPNKASTIYKPIEYKLEFNLQKTAEFSKDFLNTFNYILEVLFREAKSNRSYKPMERHNTWINGEFVNNIGFLLVYLQILLLVLAVRRKFRR